MKLLLAILIGYILGCVQTPYIAVKLIKKVDIRELGSKNAGASNATRILGFKYGILIGAVDVLKAVITIIIVKNILHGSLLYVFAAGTACIIGHVYPIFLNFKGGKGVATTIGMLLSVNFLLGICAAVIIILITVISNYVALGSVTVYALMPVTFYFLHYPNEILYISLLISALGIWKHRGNIKRIIKGNENVIFKGRN